MIQAKPRALSPALCHPVIAIALAMGLAATAPSCGGSGSSTPRDLTVLSHTPTDARVDPSEPIQIRFDKPVVGEEAIGVPVAQPPVAVEPAVAVQARWIDRQTLVLTPKAELAASTRYRVRLTGALAGRSGDFEFAFVNHPIDVDGVWGMPTDKLPPRPRLPLHFNQPVRATDVVRGCRLIGGVAGAMPAVLTTAKPDLVSEVIEVEPATALTQGQDYQLVCEKLSGAGGAEPMSEAFSQGLHTYPTFSVKSFGPKGTDVPADDIAIEIEFATPVDLEALRKRLTSKPAIAGLARGALDPDGTTYRAVVNLDVKTEYRLRIAKDLTDVFGQPLADAPSHQFKTGSARPRISFETGIYAVEPTFGGYPVWTRSVDKVALDCAEVPRASVVKVLTSEMDYDPWYDAEHPNQVDWKKLGLKRHQHKLVVTDPKNNWHLEKIQLGESCGGGERGLFLADISSPEIKPDADRMWSYRPHRRVLANVTDLGVLLRAGSGSGLVWVTSMSTGKPVAGASVQIYSPQGKQVWSGQSDERGLAMLPGTTQLLRKPGTGDRADVEGEGDGEGEEMDGYRSQRLIAVVEKGGDMAAVDGNWANGIQIWNFGVPEDRRGGTTRIRGLIQSDRGIYRPGETVHFKGLVREIAVARAPAVPTGAPVAVTVTDSRGTQIFSKKLPVTRFGGFSFDLPLAGEASTGDYTVLAQLKGQNFREKFQVEEFRKVTFEVDVATPVRHGMLGEKLGFQVAADFLFGAPVKDAKVTWEVQRRPHSLAFPSLPDYGFVDYAARGNYVWWDESSESESLSFVSDGEGKTDARGKFHFSVRDPQSKFDGPQDYLARAVVTDESDQSVGKQVVMTAHPSEFYVGLHTQEFVQAVDMPFAINTVAVKPDGTRVATKAKLTYIRESYDCTSSEGYRSYESCTTKHEPVLSRDIEIPATGNGTERILPKQPGEYVIRIEAVDARGAKVASSSYVWVLGKGEAFWSGEEDARMSLIASKSEYKAGETARLVARTSMKNPTALVTVERSGILSARVISMESSAEGFEVPIAAEHAPNVFATVAMVSGRSGAGDRNRPRFKMGVVDLKVSSEASRLNVSVKTDRPTYQPGEKVTGVVQILSGGKPVVGEVALSVADEGVLQLIAYQTPDPMKAFFATWGLGVDSGTNWNRIARLNDPMGEEPEEGGDSGSSEGGRIRSRFVSSAFWAPHLVTDERGEVPFEFTAPDNLTAFRLMAVAADDGSRFGSGESRITIKKPLLAVPVMPRFASVGDKIEVGVVVHNYTGAAGTATVKASATGVSLGKAEESVQLADGESARVRFTGRVGERAGAEAKLQFAVAMGEHSDALAVTLPIDRGLYTDQKTLAHGALGGDGAPPSIEVPVAWDASVVAGESMLTVTVDRTGLADLEPSLKYLIEYPYGCLEQTLSRFIPLAKAKDLARSLDLAGLEGPKMEAFLRAGAAKVVRHQHADGNFSLWPSGETYPHLTVFALYGLNEARRAGVKVDEAAIASGLEAMKRWALDGKRVLGASGEGGTVAMSAYMLGELGAADPGLNARLYEARRGLPRYGQAFLLMALVKAKADPTQVKTLTDELIASLDAGDEAVIVKETIDMDEVMGSDVRSTAIVTAALLRAVPDHPAIERLVAGLKKAQQPSGSWHNTQDNLYGLVALADYARTRAKGSAQVVVKLAGKRLVARTVQGGKPLVLRRKLSAIQPGALTIESQGRALYAVRVSETRVQNATTPIAEGMTVVREYLDPDTGKPIDSPKANQLVRVKLTVTTPTERRYVALSDHLPAGMEPVNSRLATEKGDAADPNAHDEHWTPPTWVHVDLRDEGALAFSDYLSAGSHIFEYNARATLPGEFKILPAKAEAMYEPEVRGRTASASMKVRR